MKRIDKALRERSARRKGEAAGAQLASEIEAKWAELWEQADADDDPSVLRARFLGWMQTLHERLDEIYAAVGCSHEEIQGLWLQVATEFCGRFRSEVLSPSYADEAEEILSDTDITKIVADVEALADEFMSGLDSDADAALDLAVKGVRAAEAAGTLAPDPRSDAEMKESIRRMWEEDDILPVQDHDAADPEWSAQSTAHSERGRELWRTRASASDIEAALEAAPDQFREFLREGMVDAMAEELRAQQGTTKVVLEVVNAGPEMDSRLRLILPDDDAFESFKRRTEVMKGEIVAENTLRSLMRFGLAGVAGAVVGAAIFGIGALGTIYAFYVAGSLLGAALSPKARPETLPGGVVAPLLGVLVIPLLLGLLVLAVLLLLAQVVSGG